MRAPPSSAANLDARAKRGGELGVYTVLNTSLRFGSSTHCRGPRIPGPTPYLGREGEEQQQRARRRRHGAQSLLLQPQHVREAPLAGDPQPRQHLRRRDKAARHAETGKSRAPARRAPPPKPRRSPAPPHPQSGAMTQHKARPTRGSREARAPESARPAPRPQGLRPAPVSRRCPVSKSHPPCPPPPQGQQEGAPCAPAPPPEESLPPPRRFWGRGRRPREPPLTLFSI